MKDHGHGHQHLPKVGTRENEEWEQREERRDILRVFGVDPDRSSRTVVYVVGGLIVVLAILGVLGLALLT